MQATKKKPKKVKNKKFSKANVGQNTNYLKFIDQSNYDNAQHWSRSQLKGRQNGKFLKLQT